MCSQEIFPISNPPPQPQPPLNEVVVLLYFYCYYVFFFRPESFWKNLESRNLLGVHFSRRNFDTIFCSFTIFVVVFFFSFSGYIVAAFCWCPPFCGSILGSRQKCSALYGLFSLSAGRPWLRRLRRKNSQFRGLWKEAGMAFRMACVLKRAYCLLNVAVCV